MSRSHGSSPTAGPLQSDDFIAELVAAGMASAFYFKMIAEQRHHPDVRIHRIKGADGTGIWHSVWRKGAFPPCRLCLGSELSWRRGTAP